MFRRLKALFTSKKRDAEPLPIYRPTRFQPVVKKPSPPNEEELQAHALSSVDEEAIAEPLPPLNDFDEGEVAASDGAKTDLLDPGFVEQELEDPKEEESVPFEGELPELPQTEVEVVEEVPLPEIPLPFPAAPSSPFPPAPPAVMPKPPPRSSMPNMLSPTPAGVTPEQLCGITPNMTPEQMKERLALLYRRYNFAAASLNAGLRAEAETALNAIVAVRDKYFGSV